MSEKLIRFAEVERRTGFSRAWLYKLINRGEFPRPRRTGARSVSFLESEINAWIQSKADSRAKV